MRQEGTTLTRLLMVQAGMALLLTVTLLLMGKGTGPSVRETLVKATPRVGAAEVARRMVVATVTVVVTTIPLLPLRLVRATRINTLP